MNTAIAHSSFFYQLTLQEHKEMVKNLSPAQIAILYYIRASHPFGDKFIEFNASKIAEDLGYRRETVSKALNKLNRENYIDMEPTRAMIRLRTRHQIEEVEDSSVAIDVQFSPTEDDCDLQVSVHNVSKVPVISHADTVTKMSHLPHEMSHSLIYKDFQTNTLKSAREEIEKNAQEQEADQEQEKTDSQHSPSLKSEPTISQQPEDDFKDHYSAAAVTPAQNISPEIRKLLDNRVFIQWWANRVSKTKFGATELEMPPIAYVRARIRKNPEAAEDMFAAFEEEMSLRIENVETRVEAGLQISEQEQEEIKAIAPYSQPKVSKPDVMPRISGSNLPQLAPQPIYPDADKDLQERIANMQRLNEMMRGVGKSMKKEAVVEPQSQFEKMRSWVRGNDSILQNEAIVWAKRRNDITVLYEADGVTPLDLVEEDAF